MKLPLVQPLSKSSQSAVNLLGLNLTGTPMDVSDGYSALEWTWTQGMDTVQQPIIRRREKRILVGSMTKPHGIYGLNKLALCDGTNFYYEGYLYSTTMQDNDKLMVGMGSDIVIFPDKKIFRTTTREWSSMEQTNRSSGTVTVTLAKPDGTAYTGYETGPTPPEDPDNGDLWLDTSEDPIVMKSWSEYTGMWVDEYTTCLAITNTGIGSGFKQDDAVEISGFSNAGLNGSHVLLSATDDTIVVTGIISAEVTETGTVTVARTVPNMDYVVEHNNRLWGCSSSSHEIYASALGDATNWRRYQGLSTDSYAVTVGSPGNFTGAAVVNSSVCFFKEDCIHKIYGTMPANFQMSVDHYRGVEAGSAGSVVRINELVYYKSRFDICAYDGAEVAGRGAKIGPQTWKNAVAGRNDRRYYVSMQDAQGAWHLLVYDTENGTWMREDGTHALGFAGIGTETFMLTRDVNAQGVEQTTGKVWALRSGEYADGAYMIGRDQEHATNYVINATPEADADIPWILRTGELAVKYANNKRLGKIQILIGLAQNTAVTVRVKKDNENWETAMTLTGDGCKKRYTLPIYPRRCDRLTVEISGTGDAQIYSISWVLEAGSEYGRT